MLRLPKPGDLRAARERSSPHGSKRNAGSPAGSGKARISLSLHPGYACCGLLSANPDEPDGGASPAGADAVRPPPAAPVTAPGPVPCAAIITAADDACAAAVDTAPVCPAHRNVTTWSAYGRSPAWAADGNAAARTARGNASTRTAADLRQNYIGAGSRDTERLRADRHGSGHRVVSCQAQNGHCERYCPETTHLHLP